MQQSVGRRRGFHSVRLLLVRVCDICRINKRNDFASIFYLTSVIFVFNLIATITDVQWSYTRRLSHNMSPDIIIVLVHFFFFNNCNTRVAW